MIFDSGADVSIIGTTFARKVGCIIEESQRQESIGIGETPYMTIGRTKIKVTTAGMWQSPYSKFRTRIGDHIFETPLTGGN